MSVQLAKQFRKLPNSEAAKRMLLTPGRASSSKEKQRTPSMLHSQDSESAMNRVHCVHLVNMAPEDEGGGDDANSPAAEDGLTATTSAQRPVD